MIQKRLSSYKIEAFVELHFLMILTVKETPASRHFLVCLEPLELRIGLQTIACRNRSEKEQRTAV